MLSGWIASGSVEPIEPAPFLDGVEIDAFSALVSNAIDFDSFAQRDEAQPHLSPPHCEHPGVTSGRLP